MGRIYFGSLFVFSLIATGCATTQIVPTPSPAPVAATRPTVVVPQDRILLQLLPLDCACGLSNVDYALMDLPGVASLDWNFNENRVWLIFVHNPRPTDDQIRTALKDTQVVLKEIHRP